MLAVTLTDGPRRGPKVRGYAITLQYWRHCASRRANAFEDERDLLPLSGKLRTGPLLS
jgi:hypothetical protein